MPTSNSGSNTTMGSLVSITLKTITSAMATPMPLSSHNHIGMSMTSINDPSSTMSMDTDSHSGDNTLDSSAGMDMMDSHMAMNSYLTRKYDKYPVVFEKLYASTKAEAFGIFILIMAAAFCYKFLLFLNWTLEIHWFKKWNKTEKLQNALSLRNNNETGVDVGGSDDSSFSFNDRKTEYYSDTTQVYQDKNGLQLIQPLPKMPNLFFDIFAPNIYDLSHDFIRVIIIFLSTMIIYMLMLAAMSFVLTYVFAVVTGLSLSEVFFNRCKTLLLRRWEIQRELDRINQCGGGNNCKCGRHRRVSVANSKKDTDATSPNQVKTDPSNDNNSNNDQEAGCCCNDGDAIAEDDRNVERNISEATKLQEQGNDMDANLMPPEKFK